MSPVPGWSLLVTCNTLTWTLSTHMVIPFHLCALGPLPRGPSNPTARRARSDSKIHRATATSRQSTHKSAIATFLSQHHTHHERQ